MQDIASKTLIATGFMGDWVGRRSAMLTDCAIILIGLIMLVVSNGTTMNVSLPLMPQGCLTSSFRLHSCISYGHQSKAVAICCSLHRPPVLPMQQTVSCLDLYGPACLAFLATAACSLSPCADKL